VLDNNQYPVISPVTRAFDSAIFLPVQSERCLVVSVQQLGVIQARDVGRVRAYPKARGHAFICWIAGAALASLGASQIRGCWLDLPGQMTTDNTIDAVHRIRRRTVTCR
jgi:hypothetical protein